MITTGAVSEEVAVVPECTEVGDPDRSLEDLKACSFRHPAVSSRCDLVKRQSRGGLFTQADYFPITLSLGYVSITIIPAKRAIIPAKQKPRKFD